MTRKILHDIIVCFLFIYFSFIDYLNSRWELRPLVCLAAITLNRGVAFVFVLVRQVRQHCLLKGGVNYMYCCLFVYLFVCLFVVDFITSCRSCSTKTLLARRRLCRPSGLLLIDGGRIWKCPGLYVFIVVCFKF